MQQIVVLLGIYMTMLGEQNEKDASQQLGE